MVGDHIFCWALAEFNYAFCIQVANEVVAQIEMFVERMAAVISRRKFIYGLIVVVPTEYDYMPLKGCICPRARFISQMCGASS